MTAKFHEGNGTGSIGPQEVKLDELYQEVILDHNRKPRNYGELCACLLQALEPMTAAAPGAVAQAGAGLGSQARGGTGRSGLQAVIRFLEARGYYPSLDEVESGTVVVLANCPYLEVARAMPHFCRFDVALLESALGARVSAETSIAKHDPSCRLRISPVVAV